MKKIIIFFFYLAFFISGVSIAQTNASSSPWAIKHYKKITQKPKRTIQVSYHLLNAQEKNASDLNSRINQMVTKKIQDFIKDSTQQVMNFPSKLNIQDSILIYKPKKIVSIQYEQFTFISGGAHPSTTHFVMNYDVMLKKNLQLSDVLQHPQKDLKTISEKAIETLKTRDLGPANFINEGTAPQFKNYQQWNFTETGLLIIFDPSQVAPYALGTQTVLIPYASLTKILKTKYLSL